MAETESAEDIKNDAGGEGDAGASDNKGADGQGSDQSGNGEDGASADGNKDDASKDEEPKTRKRNADFVAERRGRKIEKMQHQDDDGSDDGNDDSDEDAEVAPEDKKAIGKLVQRELAPILERQAQAETKAEVSDYISKNPDFKKYEAKILKYANHQAYKNVPIDAIATIVAKDDLMRLGATRAKEAESEAKRTAAGGGSAQTVDTGASKYKNMSPEEHRKELNKVMSGGK